ncbi:arad-like aldolase/epimerase [Cylindrobasidium torrendii FP15055 ss-10]|uniref:Arad-like aldolase/epimerase n=1 Tax=Cylindrobasidium torrendii FP15055 ss-10 TaxID=1314674 RepID=A0A0D7B0N5_9AGAR|nr:arad-like aldolase/epimerase [Cylindrobasidium torrendii FP15055 ss-10]
MPTFPSPEAERLFKKERLALVFRILHRFGMAEGIAGHCSMRDPVDPSTFWVNPQGRSFALMKQSDLAQCRVEDGAVIESGNLPIDASATSIHSQIYRARGPSANALVHVHSPSTKAFSALGRTLDMISQDACAYYQEQVLVPFGGAVFDNEEGLRIARLLGSEKKIAILQNHGILAVGSLAIEEAAWWMINFDMCCKAQLLADAALRPGEEYVVASEAHILASKHEMGSPEMGWFSLAAYIDEEEHHSQGAHKL